MHAEAQSASPWKFSAVAIARYFMRLPHEPAFKQSGLEAGDKKGVGPRNWDEYAAGHGTGNEAGYGTRHGSGSENGDCMGKIRYGHRDGDENNYSCL